MAFMQPPTGSTQMQSEALATYEPGEPVVFLYKAGDSIPWQAHLRTIVPSDFFPGLPTQINCVRLCDGAPQRINHGHTVHVIPASWLNLKLLL